MSWISSRRIRLLVIIFLLMVGLSTGMDMLVVGSFSGNGTNESYILAPMANVTGNNSSWLVVWEDDMYERSLDDR
jgi:hypothetical protein